MWHVSVCSMLKSLLHVHVCGHVFVWSVHLTHHPLRKEMKKRKKQKALHTCTSNASAIFCTCTCGFLAPSRALHCAQAHLLVKKYAGHNYTCNLSLLVCVVKKVDMHVLYTRYLCVFYYWLNCVVEGTCMYITLSLSTISIAQHVHPLYQHVHQLLNVGYQ